MGGILCGVRKAAVHAWPNAETYTHEAISPGVGPLAERGLLQGWASYHPRVSHLPLFQFTYRENPAASHKMQPK